VRLNDRPADTQPEPLAGHLRLIGRLHAEERRENALASVNRNAWPLVLD
jgi:hypothetical protein